MSLKTPDFYLNDLLIKSNRTGLQAYTAEERTFGTPCICGKCLLQQALYK